MSHFAQAFMEVVLVEGGYSNHPYDSGKETMYGITEAVARAHGYQGLMRDLPLHQAEAIYRRAYWDLLRLDEIALVALPIALELFDTGVNCGTGVAAEFLQRSLNALNRQQADYPDVKVDGDLGSKTLDAFKAYVYRRGIKGERVLMRALNCLQGARYIELAERREKDEHFVSGWMLNRITIA